MRRILRIFLVETAGLFIASQIASGLVFQNQIEGLVITGIALTLATKLVKPIIGVLILPLTMATLGLFKFIGHAITLYLVDMVVDEFSVGGFHFAGMTGQYLDLPAYSIDEGLMAYLAFSVLISFIAGVINWIIK